MSALFALEEVACIRGGRLLFEGLNVALGRAEALWVRGPNGAGKSSLIRLAGGLLRPVSGRVRAQPAALADDGLALDRERPLGEALRFWSRIDGADEARLEAAMTLFGLTPLQDIPVRMLSTGQARRARLARVHASGAPLWLLDEPLNGLDREGADRLAEALQRHRSDGGAVVAASHVPLPGGDWRTLELGQ